MEHIAVVGAGPVGSLAAIALAERGCVVDLYERQPQQPSSSSSSSSAPKRTSAGNTRSINLAISTRALTALETLTPAVTGQRADTGQSLADVVLKSGIPMRARMIHHMPTTADDTHVALDSQDYGIDPASHRIYSVDRARLSALLLARAAAHPRISVIWGHALQDVRFLDDKEDAGVELDFEHSYYSEDGTLQKERAARRADMVIGCDGMHSVVRRALDAHQPLGVDQSYIDSAYLELHIPAPPAQQDGSPGAWPLSPNHLHIWPRHSFMLIALPNADRSFTCTLFAPYALFGAARPPSNNDDNDATTTSSAASPPPTGATEHPLAGALSTPERALELFRTHFPDAYALMGPEHVAQSIAARAHRPGRLGSVNLRSGTYHERTRGRAVLLGDAAHAMVPFYGQGLNCGLEDVRVLAETLERRGVLPLRPSGTETPAAPATDVAAALEEYSRTRHPALCAILQLAQRNYEEMSHRVVSRTYLARRWIDGVLMRALAPSTSSSSSAASSSRRRMVVTKVVQAPLERDDAAKLLKKDEDDSSAASISSSSDAEDADDNDDRLDPLINRGGARRRTRGAAPVSTMTPPTGLSSVLDVSVALLRSYLEPTQHLLSPSRRRRRRNHGKPGAAPKPTPSSSSLSTASAPTKPPSSAAAAAATTQTKARAAAASGRALGAWKSLYTMVTFTNMPYDAVVAQARFQDRVVSVAAAAVGLGLGLGVVGAVGLGWARAA